MPLIPLEPGMIAQIPLAQIDVDPLQPRRAMNASLLEELAADIKLRGVQQPITVLPPDGDAAHYRIKTGERRFRASKLAGKRTIPCMLAAPDKAKEPTLERLFDQVKENHLREGLNALDWSWTFRRLKDEFGMSVKAIADACAARGLKHLSRPHISNLIRLTELPDWAQAAIRAEKLTAHHGRYLFTALESPEVAADVERFISGLAAGDEDAHALTVRELQELIFNIYADHYVPCDPNPGPVGFTHTDTIYVGSVRVEKPLFDLEAHRQAIGLVTVPTGHSDCPSLKFALNVVLFRELQAAAREARWNTRSAGAHATNDREEDHEDNDGDDDTPAAADRHPKVSSSGKLHEWDVRSAIHRSLYAYVTEQLLACLNKTTLSKLGAWRAFDLVQLDQDGDAREWSYTPSPHEGEGHEPLAEIDPELLTTWRAWERMDINRTFDVLALNGRLVVQTADPELLAMLARHYDITLSAYTIDQAYLESRTPDELELLLDQLSDILADPGLVNAAKGWEAKAALVVEHAAKFPIPPAIETAWTEFLAQAPTPAPAENPA
ncbi:MAG: ParB/RepB/Spo0J family partition protein [Dehalococcoidia bacterium]